MADEAPKKRLNLAAIMSVVFVAVNLAVTGGGAYLVYMATIAYEPPSIREEELAAIRKLASESGSSETDVPLIFTMEKMTVNLNGEPRRLINVEVNLEMLNKESFEEVLDIEKRAKVRDRIMSLLGEQSFADIEPIQGKLYLKDRIARELNSLLVHGIVKGVYFSEFVVQ